MSKNTVHTKMDPNDVMTLLFGILATIIGVASIWQIYKRRGGSTLSLREAIILLLCNGALTTSLDHLADNVGFSGCLEQRRNPRFQLTRRMRSIETIVADTYDQIGLSYLPHPGANVHDDQIIEMV